MQKWRPPGLHFLKIAKNAVSFLTAFFYSLYLTYYQTALLQRESTPL